MVTPENQTQNFWEEKYLLRVLSFDGFLLVLQPHHKTLKYL